MDSEGRTKTGSSRSSSRRGPRSDWRSSNQSGGTNSSANQYSSSDEDAEVRNTTRGYRPSQRTDLISQSFRLHHLIPKRDRGSNRSRATTPLSHTSDPDQGDPPSIVSLHDASAHSHPHATHNHNNLSHYRGQYSTGSGDTAAAAVMNQLGGSHGHYYQEIPQGGLHYANHLDEYDSPVLKGGRKFPSSGRRMQTGGSSLSSSDNNSDTTYAESDINSSLRAKMAALDNEAAGTPPDPAPPEVPIRGPSHHHPLLAASRRAGGAPPSANSTGVGAPPSPHYPDHHPDDTYQQPNSNVFLSQEYLMTGSSPRYGSGTAPKSPGAPGTVHYGGPSPTPDYLPVNNSQPRYTWLLGTLSSHKGSITAGHGNLTGLPAVRNDLALGSGGSFSGRGLHLGKTWRERCSWRCAAIGLILLSFTLAALLACFINLILYPRGAVAKPYSVLREDRDLAFESGRHYTLDYNVDIIVLLWCL
ncbi:probable ATP-dependent RNA helicase ddx17 [Palaemon carinicauda]|uniref:probable ATP-dependent RNA helicase ddx17 n=1 Tax=Palaemon carinicauda TaxID=392227 RepID=UPI0035B63405